MTSGPIIVIGGGASGVLLTAHLLRRQDPRLRVTLVEKRGPLGRGLAFSANRPDHVLNVPASNMSAYADERTHFREWLSAKHPELSADPFLFAPRAVYGDYLSDVLDEAAAHGSGDARLTIVQGQCVALRERPSGVEVALADGTSLVGQSAVLAVGHEEQPRGHGLAVRADSDADTPLPPDDPVMILGSGLSMVDAWLSLAARGHRGKVLIVSRHGLVPMPHARVSPLEIDAADVPFGTTMLYVTRWFRKLVADTIAAGGDWRSVVDGLRPYNQRLWQSWTPATRRQFLQHIRPFWNIHRHRLPPALHAAMVAAIAGQQVDLIAGSVLQLESNGPAICATVRRRGADRGQMISVARAYDCGGVTLDVAGSTNPAIRSLLDAGAARPDPQRIGLDVTANLEVIATDGTPSSRLFAVGPLTRGQFFEIEAIPDIRRQVADLADRLA